MRVKGLGWGVWVSGFRVWAKEGQSLHETINVAFTLAKGLSLMSFGRRLNIFGLLFHDSF